MATKPNQPSHLVAFLSGSIVAVGVGEMNVARRDLHHLFDVPTTLPDHVRVLCIGHVHLQSHLVYLEGAQKLG